MVAAYPHQASRRASASDQARQAADAPQAPTVNQAAEEVIRMTATVEAMYAVARRDPYGRAALALVWLGALIATCGLAQLHIYLRRHPLIETPAAWSEPAPASSTSAGAGRHFHPPSRAGGSAQVAGPVIHSTTPAVDDERAVFRGSAP